MLFLSGSSASGAVASLGLFTPFTREASTFIFCSKHYKKDKVDIMHYKVVVQSLN